MPTPANLVHQTAVSTGTGNFALTKVNGKNDFATAFTTGGASVFDYFICNRDAAEWERGLGHMDTTAALVRDDVLETSAGTTSKIDFSAGTKDVTNDIPALSQVRATTVASSGLLAVIDTTGGNLIKGASLLATTALVRPTTHDGMALGSTAFAFSDLFLASGGVVQLSTLANATVSHTTNNIRIGQGLLFNNDTADGNALDDYEEGTWTPEVTGSGGNPTITYNTQVGTYTKIGNRVLVTARVTIATVSGGSGAIRVSLPFAGANGNDNAFCYTSGVDWPSGSAIMVFTVSGVAVAEIYAVGDDIASAAVAPTALAAGDEIFFSLQYISA